VITACTLLVERPTGRVERSCTSKAPFGSRREARSRIRHGHGQDGTLRPLIIRVRDRDVRRLSASGMSPDVDVGRRPCQRRAAAGLSLIEELTDQAL
jgi:hypothetical protein